MKYFVKSKTETEIAFDIENKTKNPTVVMMYEDQEEERRQQNVENPHTILTLDKSQAIFSKNVSTEKILRNNDIEKSNYQSNFMNFLAVQDGFCDICGKSVNHLESHITEHVEQLPDVKSISKTKQKSKIRAKAPVAPKDHKCNSCEKTFSSSKTLTKHIKTVHERRHRDLKCDPCDKSFSDAGHLKKHIFVHDENKDLNCDVCSNGKKYSYKGLKQHLYFCRKYNPKYHQK